MGLIATAQSLAVIDFNSVCDYKSKSPGGSSFSFNCPEIQKVVEEVGVQSKSCLLTLAPK